MEPIIAIKNVSKKIKNNIILDNINLSVNKGEIWGIKGHNGSGKSMLLKALCGLIIIDTGVISIMGKSIEDGSLANIGALIEYPGLLPNLSGLKNLLLLASIKKIISKQEIVEVMNKLEMNPNDKLPFKKYSLGMRQKLGIAAAIMEYPSVLILDEPGNNLDIKNIGLVKELMNQINIEYNTTIILAGNNINDFKSICTDICEIRSGHLEVIR